MSELSASPWVSCRHSVRWLVGAVLVPAIPLVLLLAWLWTGIVAIGVDEAGLYERWGLLQPEPLAPGLHFCLPRPFGNVVRVPVGKPQTATIGFQSEWKRSLQMEISWTGSPGESNIALICGSTTDFVIVNALLVLGVDSSRQGTADYHTRNVSPIDVTVAIAEQMLWNEAAAVSLEAMLSTGRPDYSRRFREKLQETVDELRLGLKVAAFEVLSIRPPAESANAYLDVLSARIDSDREQQTARVEAKSELLRVSMMGESAVADAKAAASVRGADAAEQLAQVGACSDIYRRSAGEIQHRLFCEQISETLSGKPYMLIDSQLPDGIQLRIDKLQTTSNRR